MRFAHKVTVLSLVLASFFSVASYGANQQDWNKSIPGSFDCKFELEGFYSSMGSLTREDSRQSVYSLVIQPPGEERQVLELVYDKPIGPHLGRFSFSDPKSGYKLVFTMRPRPKFGRGSYDRDVLDGTGVLYRSNRIHSPIKKVTVKMQGSNSNVFSLYGSGADASLDP